VWRALDRDRGEPVAIKLLRDDLARQPKLVARFVQERAVLLALRHDHVVRVRDLISVGSSLGFVMDLVDGGSLRDQPARPRYAAGRRGRRAARPGRRGAG